jgi:hypothetical protein
MIARPNAALAQIRTQIMWSRLIAVVEEQAQTMLRTAFSTPVREAGDLSAGVFDRHGRMLAQAVTGTPGHVNSMANAVKHFLDVYPLATMKPGDHRRAVRQHDPCGGYRRARHGTGRTAGVRGGPVHSGHAARPRGPHE